MSINIVLNQASHKLAPHLRRLTSRKSEELHECLQVCSDLLVGGFEVERSSVKAPSLSSNY